MKAARRYRSIRPEGPIEVREFLRELDSVSQAPYRMVTTLSPICFRKWSFGVCGKRELKPVPFIPCAIPTPLFCCRVACPLRLCRCASGMRTQTSPLGSTAMPFQMMIGVRLTRGTALLPASRRRSPARSMLVTINARRTPGTASLPDPFSKDRTSATLAQSSPVRRPHAESVQLHF